jgi:hypothetical protein
MRRAEHHEARDAMSTRPRPITVENSWLNKSLEDRIQILRTIAPAKVDALGMILDDALRMEWDRMGPPYGTGPKCDEPRVTKKGGA